MYEIFSITIFLFVEDLTIRYETCTKFLNSQVGVDVILSKPPMDIEKTIILLLNLFKNLKPMKFSVDFKGTYPTSL